MKKCRYYLAFAIVVSVCLLVLAGVVADESTLPPFPHNESNWIDVPVSDVICKINENGYTKIEPPKVFSSYKAYENKEMSIERILFDVNEDTFYTTSVIMYCKADASAEAFFSDLTATYGKMKRIMFPSLSGVTQAWSSADYMIMVNYEGSFDDVKHGKEPYTYLVFVMKETGSKSTDESRNTSENKENDQISYETIDVGETISLPVLDMVLQKSGIANELRFTEQETKGLAHSLYKTKQNATYIYIKGTIKNLSKQPLVTDSIVGKMIIDGYEYDIRIFSPAGRIEPLETQLYYLYALVPDELVKKYDSCVIRLGINDDLSLARNYEGMDHKYEITLK